VTRKICKGTPLKVFSGKEAKLNYIIFLVLLRKGTLTSYETWKEIHAIKGYKRYNRQSIDRRMKELRKQNWLLVIGVKPAQAHFLQPIYQLSTMAETAFEISKTDFNSWLQKASDAQKKKLIEDLHIYG
jgi:hypothetical protein